MKYLLTFALLTTLLGGCAVVPLGYGYRGDGYSRGQGYYRGDGYYRYDGHHRHDRRGYGYQDRWR